MNSLKSESLLSGDDIPPAARVIDGTPQKQAAFYATLLAFAQEHNIRFVISFLHRDYDAL